MAHVAPEKFSIKTATKLLLSPLSKRNDIPFRITSINSDDWLNVEMHCRVCGDYRFALHNQNDRRSISRRTNTQSQLWRVELSEMAKFKRQTQTSHFIRMLVDIFPSHFLNDDALLLFRKAEAISVSRRRRIILG